MAESTRKLCEGYFTLKPLGPTRVKGVTESVNVYEVTGLGPLRTRLQRSAGRGYTKFVGRQREMDAMKVAAEQAKAGHGQIVAAMAEAGVGKSRLMFEFKATSASGWMVLGDFLSLAWQSFGLSAGDRPPAQLLRLRVAGRSAHAARKNRVARITILDRTLEDCDPVSL